MPRRRRRGLVLHRAPGAWLLGRVRGGLRLRHERVLLSDHVELDLRRLGGGLRDVRLVLRGGRVRLERGVLPMNYKRRSSWGYNTRYGRPRNRALSYRLERRRRHWQKVRAGYCP